MVYSMTGFGRSELQAVGRNIAVEVKSVNHRYFEYTSRLPRAYGALDDALRKKTAAALSRGKVEVSVFIQTLTAQDTLVTPDMALATGYLTALRQMGDTLGLEDDVTLATLARFNDVFSQTRAPGSMEEAEQAVLQALGQALDAHTAMRRAEGEKLQSDILGRLQALEQAVEEVEKTSAQRVEKYRDKLYQKLRALLEETSIEEGRILQEAAIYADKTAVDEETVRLRSHIAQYRDILAAGGPVGKKLDFLTQELNRETNTIGSKASEVDITRLVVNMKSEIEKIREQVQNVE